MALVTSSGGGGLDEARNKQPPLFESARLGPSLLLFILSASTSERWEVNLSPVACGNKTTQLLHKQQRMQPEFRDHLPAPEWF